VLKWYPVSFKDHSVGQILIEASYEAENVPAKNAPISQPQKPVQQAQPISVLNHIPQVAPVQYDYRQPDLNQEQRFAGGHIHGYNPLIQPPQNVQPGFNPNTQPAGEYSHPVQYERQDQMYAPPISAMQQDSGHPQKYPQLDPHPYSNGYDNQSYGYQHNAEQFNDGGQDRQPYVYDSRPVTDFPLSGAQDKQRGYDPMDLIRGAR